MRGGMRGKAARVFRGGVIGSICPAEFSIRTPLVWHFSGCPLVAIECRIAGLLHLESNMVVFHECIGKN